MLHSETPSALSNRPFDPSDTDSKSGQTEDRAERHPFRETLPASSNLHLLFPSNDLPCGRSLFEKRTIHPLETDHQAISAARLASLRLSAVLGLPPQQRNHIIETAGPAVKWFSALIFRKNRASLR